MTAEELRAQVARVVGIAPEEVEMDEELMLLGLDSIRLMSLVTEWRAAGLEVTFEDLAERPTLGEWAELLAR